jgi:hypothetical protein
LADKVSEIRKNDPLLLKKEPWGVHFSEQASDQCSGLIIGEVLESWGRSNTLKNQFEILAPTETKNDNLLLFHGGTMDKTLISYRNVW